MASCTPAESATGTEVTPVTRLTTIGCAQPDLCICTPLVGGTRSVESGTSVNLAISLGTGGTATKLYGPASVIGEVVGTDLKLIGTLPAGKHALVYEMTNDCSTACVVLEVTVKEACLEAGNKTKNITYITGKYTVDVDIPIPEGSTISTHTEGGLTYAVYGSVLNVSGTLTYPYLASYSVNLTGPCGPQTVSGAITPCAPPVVKEIVGVSVFEKGVSSSIGWVVDGTGPLTLGAVTGLPAGMNATIQNNTPAPGQSTVSVSGTPTDNPCTGTSCEAVVSVAGPCGGITLKRKYTQQPCRSLKVVKETGSKVFTYDQPGSYCKIVEGYTPVSLDNFDGVPYGLEVTVTPGPAVNQYTICLSGTPTKDLCTDFTKEICECVKATISNECGSKDIELCYTMKAAKPPCPTYCIMVASATQPDATGAPGQWLVKVWGGIAGSVVTMGNNVHPVTAPNTTATITLDSDGCGELLVAKDETVAGCITLTHPTCAIVRKDMLQLGCTTPVVVDPAP